MMRNMLNSLQEARPCVKLPEHPGDMRRHPRALHRGDGQRLAVNELEDQHVHVGELMDDPRGDPRRGRRPRVMKLIGAIDREPFRPVARDAYHIRHAVHVDTVDPVGESPDEGCDDRRSARPGGNPVDDLVDRDGHDLYPH